MAKFLEFMHHPWLARLRRHPKDSAAASPSVEIEANPDGCYEPALSAPAETPAAHPQPQAASIAHLATVSPLSPPAESTNSSAAADAEATAPGWSSSPTPARNVLPRTAQVGLLGLAVVVLWWTWPRADGPDLTFAAVWNSRNPAPEAAALAVVNPANAARATAAAQSGIMATLQSVQATATPFFPSIIVVTPTAVGRAADTTAAAGSEAPPVIILESSALITESAPARIELELPAPALLPAVAVEPETPEETVVIELLPTATPTPGAATQDDAPANIPRVEIVPVAGQAATATPIPPTATPTVNPSPTPPKIGPGRLWSTFTPRPAAQSDHFWVANPFAGFASNRFASPNYQFGSTAGNRYRPHHGLDISNPLGTPVQAGVEGVVVHAGPDDPDVLGPYPNFYGQTVVILLDRRLPVAGGELDVYVLHGHLSEVRVTVGQRVQPGDIVGLVGMTGIAIGPHLHIEVRLGANTYSHTVNPWLWLQPAPGNGVVAVRVLTADGRTWAGAKVSIARFQGGQAVWARQIETYLDTENIGPDPAWGENGVMGDVPAGSYYLIANIDNESIRAEFEVRAGETTFVEIRTSR